MNNEAATSDFRELDKGKTDVEPSTASSLSDDALTPQKRPNDSAFSRLSRELSEEDLNASGTKKMILNLVDSLSDENRKLTEVKSKYHDIDKKYAVLQEKFDNLRICINIKNILSMGGSVLLGLLPTLVSRKWDIWAIVVIGIFALIMALLPYLTLALSWKNRR